MRRSVTWGIVSAVFLAAQVVPGVATPSAVVARSWGGCQPSCWRSSHPQHIALKVGATHRVQRLSLGGGTTALLHVPKGTTASVAKVTRVGRVPGLTTKPARGVFVTVGTGQKAPTLRFRSSKRLTVVAANRKGGDLHRIPILRGGAIPVLQTAHFLALPQGAAKSPWFSAAAEKHMPADLTAKLEHVIAPLIATGRPRSRKSGAMLQTVSITRLTQTMDRYWEYVGWLQDKYRSDPERSATQVSEAWERALHESALLAEMGLIDMQVVHDKGVEYLAYLEHQLQAWLDRVSSPCIGKAEAAVALRIIRTAAIKGVTVTPSLHGDLPFCGQVLAGRLTVDTKFSRNDASGTYLAQPTTILDVDLKVGRPVHFNEGDSSSVTDAGTRVQYSGHTDSTEPNICGGGTRTTHIAGGPYQGPVRYFTAQKQDFIVLQATWDRTSASHDDANLPSDADPGCVHTVTDVSGPATEELRLLGRYQKATDVWDFTGRLSDDTTVSGHLKLSQLVR